MVIGFWQIIIILAIVFILFGGKGKIISFFTDFAKGIKILRKELLEEDKKTSEKDIENR